MANARTLLSRTSQRHEILEGIFRWVERKTFPARIGERYLEDRSSNLLRSSIETLMQLGDALEEFSNFCFQFLFPFERIARRKRWIVKRRNRNENSSIKVIRILNRDETKFASSFLRILTRSKLKFWKEWYRRKIFWDISDRKFVNVRNFVWEEVGAWNFSYITNDPNSLTKT